MFKKILALHTGGTISMAADDSGAVITNEVGGDGEVYAWEPMAYILLMVRLNSLLAEKASQVVEVVYGIPVVLKGETEG